MKQNVHEQCLLHLHERIKELEASIADARLSSQSDTKSSAGDKHETGRAMAQLEIEKQQASLGNLIGMLAILQRIDPQRANERVGEGALVRTDRGLYYIAVGLGRVSVNGQEVVVISPQAPLAALFKGTSVGGTASYNGVDHTLIQIA
ncbi:MAG: hypothetical protein IPP33_09285 [Flavobacteriales bacterium]|nr:hypothetical protein [Flavobacteriales bacterium]